MSKLKIFFSKLFNIKSVTPIYKGSDLSGNKFFEIPSNDVKKIKPKRYIEGIEFQGFHDVQVPKIPSQWEAWLRFQRTEPPTLDELKYHESRVETLKQKAKILEAKYDEDRKQLKAQGLISDEGSKVAPDDRIASSFPIREEYERPEDLNDDKKH